MDPGGEEIEFAQLGHTVDAVRNLVPEILADLLDADSGVSTTS
jgi:hypothetical protein